MVKTYQSPPIKPKEFFKIMKKKLKLNSPKSKQYKKPLKAPDFGVADNLDNRNANDIYEDVHLFRKGLIKGNYHESNGDIKKKWYREYYSIGLKKIKDSYSIGDLDGFAQGLEDILKKIKY